MPQFGIGELLIILVIVVIFFGVGKLPELGGAIGKSLTEFRRASQPNEPTTPPQPNEEPTAKP